MWMDATSFDEGGGMVSKEGPIGEVSLEGKDAMIVGHLDDFFLKPPEGFWSFSIQQRHVDAEDSKQTVSQVLLTCCLSLGSPGHAVGNAVVAQSLLLLQTCLVYAGNSRDENSEGLLRTQDLPVPCIELDIVRGDELLESPATSEPSASSKGVECIGIGR